eukprot:TRINITY_DN6637_c0_g1_i1.p1 TRINITY_DN6637_c0_g1~~TRINITY_DN6637_c0_g1_i1.p1  ORF type:complete len:217 (+),score=47.37 TRINITY_DN6637_c0_g1_i1:116-766(+)
MRELDSRVQNDAKVLDKKQIEYLAILKLMKEKKEVGSRGDPNALLEEINRVQKEMLANSAEKREIATQLFEMIEDISIKIEEDIKKLEEDIKQNNPDAFEPNQDKAVGDYTGRKKKRHDYKSESKLKSIKAAAIEEKIGAATTNSKEHGSSDHYCICKQPSYGEMIKCDNPLCSVEWFHVPCVGVNPKNMPKVWYCKDCQALLKNKYANLLVRSSS